MKSKRNGLAAKVQVRNKFRKDLNVLFPAKMGINWVIGKNTAGSVRKVAFGVEIKQKLHVKKTVRLTFFFP